MVRSYKRKTGARNYRNYTNDTIQEAISAVKNKHMSVNSASKMYNIPRRTLSNKLNESHVKKPGHPTVFTPEEEQLFTSALITTQKWGFPFDIFDFKLMIKAYLDKKGKNCNKFKNNLPGYDFCKNFLKRNPVIASRTSNNIKRSRANVSPAEITDYFVNLENSIKDVPPQNIFNYDESNLSDDPGRKKVMARRGCKYVDRIVNSSKSANSIMVCGSANGELLPIYTVYKSTELWDTWCTDGPKGKPFCESRCCAGGARFNRSKSGWFETETFSDWFNSTFLPHARNLDGKKILIGDNLSSHFSTEILRQCEENNVSFICLPPNSTHLCQPLDVSFFSPMKKAWRKVLSQWKECNKRSNSVPKAEFPKLLRKLCEEISENCSKNLKSGFRTCGIFPLQKDEVLAKLPEISDQDENREILSTSLTELLQTMRYDKQTKKQAKKRKLTVTAGKSISTSDITKDISLSSTTKKSCTKKGRKENVENPCSLFSYQHQMPSTSAQPLQSPTTCTIKKFADLEILKGNLIVTKYEKNWWIGKVMDTSKENNDVKVHFMTPSGPSTSYQWGDIREMCWVPKNCILGLIPSELLQPIGASLRSFKISKLVTKEISEIFKSFK